MDIRSDGQVVAVSGGYIGSDPAKVKPLKSDDFLIRFHDAIGDK